ncbi:MAG: hypothetical protein DME18_13580 [Verrucomicrobia bacterium]|nr:MAG: hypothetical protein DME18_13580 [Verrucomicrobiota bacterium]
MGRGFRSAVDADFEVGGEAGDFLSCINVLEHVGTEHGQAGRPIDELLQVLQFQNSVLDLGLAQQGAARISCKIGRERAAGGAPNGSQANSQRA